VIDLLKAYFKIQDRNNQRDIREKVTGKLLTLDKTLESAVPALLSLLDIAAEDQQWQSLDPLQRRQRTLEAIKHLLLRESQVQSLLLVFEDLHWIDSETQAVFDSLVDSLPTARLLLLVNYRPEYQHGWGSKTYYRQLRIDPLPPETADALLHPLLGDDPSLDRLRQLLIARTEGNPLFLEEGVRTLIETGVLAGERGAYRLTRTTETIEIPATVQAILAGRIDRLAPEDKRLLQAASVIGTDVSWPLLRAIAEVPEDHLRSGLARLHTAEFLYETRLFPDLEFTFKHALTHEVAYESLLHDRRRVLHARIVDAIEHLWVDRTAEHAASLARHAFRGERWQQALAYSRQAAARAQAQSAYREAVGCLEQALAALPHLPPEPATVEQAIDIRLELRNALFGLGDHGRIILHLREAAELARMLGDQRRLGRAAAIVALSLWATGEHERASESARQAETIAATLGDASLEVLADFYLGVTHYAVGDYRRSASHLARNLTTLAGERWRERFGLMGPPAIFCRSFLAWSLAELGEFEKAYARGQEAVDWADVLAEPFPQLHSLLGLSLPYLRRGEVARARPVLERAIELCERWTFSFWLPTAAADLGYVYTLSGWAVKGLSLLERAVREASAMGMRGNQPIRLTYLAEALLSLGRVVEARACAEEALALARQLGEHGHAGWAFRLLGEIDALSGEPDVLVAKARYRESLALAEHLGMRPLIAHCHVGLGKLYRRTGNNEKAKTHLTNGVAMMREMEMGVWLERAEAELNELG
jgi:tetratricopeptide (TPR) repeat protein